MKRKIAIVGTFWLVILACLALIAAKPWAEPELDLNFSEGCLRGYLWDASIQHIACGLYEEGSVVVTGPDDGNHIYQPPVKDPKDTVIVPPTKPTDPVIVPPPADDPDQPEQDQDKKCPKQDNLNKQGHHNCGKGPGPGEHDNGNGNGGQDHGNKGDEKGKGRNK
jgi:hypothetical protein